MQAGRAVCLSVHCVFGGCRMGHHQRAAAGAGARAPPPQGTAAATTRQGGEECPPLQPPRCRAPGCAIHCPHNWWSRGQWCANLRL